MDTGYRLSAFGFRLSVLALVIGMFLFTSASAQVLEEAPADSRVTFGPPDTIRIRIGAEVTANHGAARNISVLIAAPLVCPEQDVKIISEDFSSNIGQVDYRPLTGGEIKQMVITIPRLAAGATATATVTFEVATRPILPPEKTDDLVIPKRVPRSVRPYTGGSPYIETKHQKIRSLAKEILEKVDATATDWQRVEAIYDYVLDHVKYVEGPDKGALETLRDGQADCQGRSMLIIALCRASKVPARMVWVDGHAYAEFYLEDAEGHGYWFPCESAGTRAFGEMPLARTILQKGDNIRVPERPTERLRYASDYMIGLPIGNAGRPHVKFIREPATD
jgi:transglutaminase-like putative cysteine protease